MKYYTFKDIVKRLGLGETAYYYRRKGTRSSVIRVHIDDGNRKLRRRNGHIVKNDKQSMTLFDLNQTNFLLGECSHLRSFSSYTCREEIVRMTKQRWNRLYIEKMTGCDWLKREST